MVCKTISFCKIIYYNKYRLSKLTQYHARTHTQACGAVSRQSIDLFKIYAEIKTGKGKICENIALIGGMLHTEFPLNIFSLHTHL